MPEPLRARTSKQRAPQTTSQTSTISAESPSTIRTIQSATRKPATMENLSEYTLEEVMEDFASPDDTAEYFLAKTSIGRQYIKDVRAAGKLLPTEAFTEKQILREQANQLKRIANSLEKLTKHLTALSAAQ